MSISIFNLVSKLFNVPLLNITTSFVAEEQALISKSNDGNLISFYLFTYLFYLRFFLFLFLFFDV